MNSSVRIAKRAAAASVKDSQANPTEKTIPQMARDIETNVKSWVAEFRQRKSTVGLPRISTAKC